MTTRGLSPSQRGIWLGDSLAGGHSPYVITKFWTVPGPLDVTAMQEALDILVGRHEALRTAVSSVGGSPRQQVRPGVRCKLETWDQFDANRVSAFFGRPFDLGRPPPLRMATGPRPGSTEHMIGIQVHHLLCDGPGLELALGDLAAAYRGCQVGHPAALPESAPGFGDYLDLLAQRLAGPETDAALATWARRLTPQPSAAWIPGDRPRPSWPSYSGASAPVPWPGSLTGQVEAMTRRDSLPAFAVILAAVAVVIADSSGIPDVCIGVPVSGSELVIGEPCVGMTAHVVPVRLRLPRSASFTAVAEIARDALAEAIDDAWLSAEVLLERLPLHRPSGVHPLFQVIVSYSDARHAAPFAVGDLRTLPARAPGNLAFGARADLTFDIVRDSAGTHARLEYSTDLYSPRAAAAVCSRLAAGLTDLTADPSRPVDLPGIALAWPRQHAAGQAGLERPPSGLPADLTPELIDQQADLTPDAPAVAAHGCELSYRELAGRAESIAARLAAVGVARESRVGVLLDRTPGLVATLLGVWKAGGAYVPLDPAYPADRLAFIAADAGLDLLVTKQRWAGLLPGLPALLIDNPEGPPQARPRPPAFTRHPHDLSHVIYTSGSTGLPKGVLVTHGSVAALVRWARQSFPAEALARVLATTSLCFDISVFELFVPLATGHTVVLARDLLELWDTPPAAPVTLVNTVPSVLGELLSSGRLPPTTRLVNLAGEPLPRPMADKLYAAGVAEVRNLYGPSEATTYSTGAVVPAAPGGIVTIGTPIAGTTAYVLDGALRRVPDGSVGELYLGGAGVARGYGGQPALTAQRFVADPFGGTPGARMYRTGDRVRRLTGHNGELEFIGRSDRQIKIRGFRIEPGEIEAWLSACPGVNQACCVPHHEPAGGLRLVAYMTGDNPDPGRAREYLAQRLPSFMIPSYFVRLHTFPRTPNGKVDRGALPPPSLRPARPEPVAPAHAQITGVSGRARGPRMAELIAETWREVLEVPVVDPERTFFEHGGTSLLLAQVHAGLTARGIAVPLIELFRRPTVRQLAESLENGQ